MGDYIAISVLTPIYNHKIEYVRKCLDSLKAQTIKNIEFILIDNGSSKDSQLLIKEYVNSDSRFKSIRFEENQGYGKAMNAGIDIAKGEYIGIVESDDFIKPDMYEKLYQIVLDTNVDIVKGNYISYYENKALEQVSTFTYPENKTNIILTKETSLEIPFGGACQWTGIYRKQMILDNDCYFSTYPGASGQDTTFVLKTWIAAKSFYIYSDLYYYYRLDNNNSSRYKFLSTAYGDANECKHLNSWMNKYKNRYTELEWAVYAKNIYNRLLNQLNNRLSVGNVNLLNKTKFYLTKVLPIFKSIMKEKRINYSLTFSADEYKNLEFAITHPLLFVIRKFKISYKQRDILKNIFSVRNDMNKQHKIITILGIKVKFRKKKKTTLDKIKNFQYKLYDMQKSNIEAAAIHPPIFSEYKNKYCGRKIVIIGCGPSAIHYTPIKDAIHIGVNRAFKLPNINLDYLFVQDYMDEEDMCLADTYLPGKCKKFYGIISDLRLQEVYPQIKRISLNHIINANANQYILKSGVSYIFPFDIAYTPFSDIGGTTFSALQFALYTNPEKIYLVGCDCSSGHFHKESINGLGADVSGQKPSWHRFKKYHCDYNIKTEIISVNPVALKGMFKDVYTQSYIDEHPDLLNKNIVILDNGYEINKNIPVKSKWGN